MPKRNLTILRPEEIGLTYGTKRQWYFKLRSDFFCDSRISALTGDSLRVFMVVILQSLRQNKPTISISEEFIKTQTSLEQGVIKLSLRELKENDIIELQTNVRIQLIEENKREENRIEQIGNSSLVTDGDSQVSKPCVKKKSITSDVIEHLNKKTGKSYKTSSKTTKVLIQARVNDGYGLDDFKHVIDVKTNQWLENPKMCIYLRPKTLFSPKFEDYLQEEIEGDPLESFFKTEIEKHGLDISDFKA